MRPGYAAPTGSARVRGRAADRRVARRARLRARVAQPGEALLRFCASARRLRLRASA
ncbi:hypothetical protein Y023_5105 [Burkholderia pseudomallei A79D]|nr:hypothetical protein Y023_5105 [Burkholderia pseudomallei A79D]KGX97303.1 hypothetical protein X997_4788 [Burkholderia pseudomallei A79C]